MSVRTLRQKYYEKFHHHWGNAKEIFLATFSQTLQHSLSLQVGNKNYIFVSLDIAFESFFLEMKKGAGHYHEKCFTYR